MPELIVVSFESDDAADRAYRKVQLLQEQFAVELAGLALVHVDPDGSTSVETPEAATRTAATAGSGALFGAILGLIFLVPFFGLVVGGALGALFAGLDKTGLNAAFRDRVKAAVSEGRSAVVIYAARINAPAFGEALRAFGGTVVQTSLSEQDEHELAHDLTASV